MDLPQQNRTKKKDLKMIINRKISNQQLSNQKPNNQKQHIEAPVCNSHGSLDYLTFPILSETGIVSHLFSTRNGGVSEGVYSTLNFSFSRGDNPEHVLENYKRIAAIFGKHIEDIVTSDQTHTTNIRRVTRADAGKGITRERDYHDIDGLLTNERGLILATFFADCVPLYFVDPVQHAIGLSHSGWRGTVGKMGLETVLAMKREFGSNEKDIVCAIGPSICKDCYEVSEDVILEFEHAFGSRLASFFYEQKGNGKYQLDLWEANRQVLLEAGILPEHIQVTDICTCCNFDLLFSHRASHGKRGNLGAFMCLT